MTDDLIARARHEITEGLACDNGRRDGIYFCVNTYAEALAVIQTAEALEDHTRTCWAMGATGIGNKLTRYAAEEKTKALIQSTHDALAKWRKATEKALAEGK